MTTKNEEILYLTAEHCTKYIELNNSLHQPPDPLPGLGPPLWTPGLLIEAIYIATVLYFYIYYMCESISLPVTHCPLF